MKLARLSTKIMFGLRRALPVYAAALLFSASILHAQMPLQADDPEPAPTVPTPSFEIVSVKENPGTGPMMRVRFLPAGFDATNLPLRDLIVQAYGVRQDMISGLPDWASSLRFDVHATVADSDVPRIDKLTRGQRRQMIAAILSDRFHLKVHTELRTLPTYDLVVDKGGPKLKVSTAPPPDPARDKDSPPDMTRAGMFSIGPGSMTATGVPLNRLTNQLTYITHRTVVDKTGLAGKYDIDIRWTPDEKTAAAEDYDSGGEEPGSIFSALHDQLGLRLVPSRGPVETLIVDHVEKPTPD